MTFHLSKLEEDFGFVILCPERNLGGLKNTVNSIKLSYPKSKYLCVVGDDATDEEMREFSQYTEIYKASHTITSLMNVGMGKSRSAWNAIIFAGSWVRGNLYRKFDLFATSEKDILFPVVDWKTNFVDGSMNGIIIHKNTFLEVGDFPTSNMQKRGCSDLELIKLFWSFEAIEKGCVFKAIIGMRTC